MRACAWMLHVVVALLLAVGAVRAQAVSGCPPGAPDPASLRPEALQADVRDRGFLWKVDRDGRTSWLYGTMHIGQPRWLVPGPQIAAAFRASDLLVLELDPAAPEVAQALQRRLDPARSQRVLAGLEPGLRQAIERACLPAPAVAAMPPLMQLMMVMLAEARRADLHPEFGAEMVLTQLARIGGRRIVALESAAAQLDSVLPESESEERELVRRGLEDFDAGTSAKVMRQLAQVWASGDEATLTDYPAWCQCTETESDRRMLKRMMDERNVPMADKLAALHAGGERFFGAVGALHMVGPQGLPALLRERGFTVRRVPFPRNP